MHSRNICIRFLLELFETSSVLLKTTTINTRRKRFITFILSCIYIILISYMYTFINPIGRRLFFIYIDTLNV